MTLAARASIITVLRPTTTASRSLARGGTPVPCSWRATLRGPGEFNYCLYAGESLTGKLDLGEFTYATCADGIAVGTRSIALETNYGISLTGLGFPGNTPVAGQGAHYNGVIDVTGYVAVALWIDPPA